MDILSSEIQISDMRVISEGISQGRTVPRIYLFAGGEPIPGDVIKSIHTSFDATSAEERNEGSVTIPLYYIRDIEVVDEYYATVNISIAYEGFAEANQPDFVNGIRNSIYRIKVPTSALTLLRALFRSEDGAVWHIRGGKPVEDNYFSPFETVQTPPLFSVAFPPEYMSEIWDNLDHAMLNISTGIYADPADTYSMSYSTGAPPSLRVAQQETLRVLLALTGGHVEESKELLDAFSEAYKKDIDGQYVSRGHRADVSAHIRDLLWHAYMGSLPDSEEMQNNVHIAGTGSEDEESRKFDEAFESMMAESDLDVTLQRIADDNPLYVADPDDEFGVLDPLINGVPLSLLAFTQYLSENEPEVLEMCRWDFRRENVMSMAVEKHGEEKVARAIIITIALRFGRFFEVNDIKEGTFMMLVRLLTLNYDPYPWEFGSFNASLIRNETGGFKDMLDTRVNVPEGIPSNIYLVPSLITLVHILDEEEWSLENLDSRILQAKSPSGVQITEIRSLLACLVDKTTEFSDDDDEDERNPVMSRVSRTMETYEPEFLSKSVAGIIPVMADVNASRDGRPRNSESWRRSRKMYINDLMNKVSFRFARRLNGA